MTKRPSTCLQCGAQITNGAVTGRAKRYCDKECRNASKRITRPRLPDKRKGKGQGLMFLLGHTGYKGDSCLIWPWSKNRGYGQLSIGLGPGKVRKAHRVMCELAHGDPPSTKHEAAHSCGNHSCVNPRHLAWKTRSENQLDSVAMGRVYRGGRRGKLNRAFAERIRRLKGKLSQDQIAKMFDVTHGTVAKIHRGEMWK